MIFSLSSAAGPTAPRPQLRHSADDNQAQVIGIEREPAGSRAFGRLCEADRRSDEHAMPWYLDAFAKSAIEKRVAPIQGIGGSSSDFIPSLGGA